MPYITIMTFIKTIDVCFAIHPQLIWFFRWIVHIILRGVGDIGDMVLPGAVAEERHVLPAGVEQAEQEEGY